MAVYVSKYRRFSVADEKRRAGFRTSGGGSYYQTDDPDEIRWIEGLPNFKKDFVRTDTIPQKSDEDNIRRQELYRRDIATAEEQLKAALKSAVEELLQLYPKVYTASGSKRKDADESILERISELKREIGLIEEVA